VIQRTAITVSTTGDLGTKHGNAHLRVTSSNKCCQNLHFLNLEGNLLGEEAARSIGLALASHCEFKRALWSDVFTARFRKNKVQCKIN
jgi:Ran GTPase-activating protein (RanGAP) involved in mRNA processing and transport